MLRPLAGRLWAVLCAIAVAAPVPAEGTIESYAFRIADDESKAKGGAAVSIPDLIHRAKRKR